MTTFKKISAIALTALTLAVATAPSAEARWRHRHGGAIAAGLIGGAVLGAAMAGSGYGYGYARPVYAEPSYEGCYRKVVGHTYYGRPIVRTVCY
jgi:hypothetical protein